MFIMCTVIPIIAVVLWGYKELNCKEYLEKIVIYTLICNSILLASCSILYTGASVVLYMEQFTSFSVKYLVYCIIDK